MEVYLDNETVISGFVGDVVELFRVRHFVISAVICGRGMGNFHPGSTSGHGLLKAVSQKFRCVLLAPSLGAPTRIIPFRIEENYTTWHFHNDFMMRSDRPDETNEPLRADGLVTSLFSLKPCNPSLRFMPTILSADCGVGVAFHKRMERLALLHLAQQCVEGAWQGKENILDNLLSTTGTCASEWKLWAGFAAGSCCYGHDVNHPKFGAENRARIEQVTKVFGAKFIQPVKHGPRRKRSDGEDPQGIDLMCIVCEQARHLGFAEVASDPTCISCYGMEDPNADGHNPYWWSNIRARKDLPGGATPRNFFGVLITKT